MERIRNDDGTVYVYCFKEGDEVWGVGIGEMESDFLDMLHEDAEADQKGNVTAGAAERLKTYLEFRREALRMAARHFYDEGGAGGEDVEDSDSIDRYSVVSSLPLWKGRNRDDAIMLYWPERNRVFIAVPGELRHLEEACGFTGKPNSETCRRWE